jgi:hypothetical protein
LAGAAVTSETWTGIAAPTPGGEGGQSLDGVWCAAPSDCIAVGSVYAGPTYANYEPLAEAWNGKVWNRQTLATIPDEGPGGNSGGLADITCTSIINCVAVGAFENVTTDLTWDTVAEFWNGSHWSVQSTLNSKGAGSGPNYGSYLDHVSCGSPTYCMAMGEYTSLNKQSNLIEVWNGKEWKVVKNVSGVFLNDVSCVSSTACVAVGSGTSEVELWNGENWSSEAVPESPTGGVLQAVSCVSTTNCTAVGISHENNSESPTYAEHWTGTGWVEQSMPGTGHSWRAITCTSAADCTAVGQVFNATTISNFAAAYWNGSSWKLAKLSQQTNSSYSSLGGVSCTAIATCMSVGSYQQLSDYPGDVVFTST